MSNKTQTNFWLDSAIFAAFAATALTGLLLGVVLHEGRGSQAGALSELNRNLWKNLHAWAGLVMLADVVIHHVLHWEWIKNVGRRYFEKLARPARVHFSLGGLLLVALALATVTGLANWLVLSGNTFLMRHTSLDGALLVRHVWNDLHMFTGLALMAILMIHITLHWKWIVCMTSRYVRDAFSTARSEPGSSWFI